MDKFDDFILFPRLEKELRHLSDHPEEIDAPLIFHGLPGIGKTSFAKYLSEKHASNHWSFDGSNENKKQNDMLVHIKNSMMYSALDGDDNKHFSRAYILDEWHDLSDIKQNQFKITFDEITDRGDSLVILCLNTSPKHNKETLEKLVTPAIVSRCDVYDFTPLAAEVEDVIEILQDKYPSLSEDWINNTYPDLRKITRRGRKTLS